MIIEEVSKGLFQCPRIKHLSFFMQRDAACTRTRGPDSPEGKSAKPTGGKIRIALLAPPYPQLKNPCRWSGSSFPAQKLSFCVWIAPAESISCTNSRYLCTERKFDCNPCTFSWFLCRKLVLSVQPCTKNQFLCRVGSPPPLFGTSLRILSRWGCPRLFLVWNPRIRSRSGLRRPSAAPIPLLKITWRRECPRGVVWLWWRRQARRNPVTWRCDVPCRYLFGRCHHQVICNKIFLAVSNLSVAAFRHEIAHFVPVWSSAGHLRPRSPC